MIFGDWAWPVFPRVIGLVILLLIIWEGIWKGIALWKAGRNAHLAWFICLFIINTLGILPIIYIFGYSKKKGEAGGSSQIPIK